MTRYLLPLIMLAGCSTGGAFHNPSCLFFCTSDGIPAKQTKEKQNEAPVPAVPVRPVP
jgi:hypothetical protein